MKLLVLLGLVAIGTNAIRISEQKHDGYSPDYDYPEKEGNICKNST